MSAFTLSCFARVVCSVARTAHSHVDSHVAQDRVVFAKNILLLAHERSTFVSLSSSSSTSSTSQSRCRSINTATIHRMRSMALWPKQPLQQKSTSSVLTRIDGFIIGTNGTAARHACAEQRRKRGPRVRGRMRRWTVHESTPERAREPRSICDATPMQQEHWRRDKVCPREHGT